MSGQLQCSAQAVEGAQSEGCPSAVELGVELGRFSEDIFPSGTCFLVL